MARQSADPVFAVLARKRPDLFTAHFGLTVLLDANPSASSDASFRAHEASAAECQHVPQQGPEYRHSAPILGFSVPKRVLARAVDRNAVRRVAREAWRAVGWNPGRRPQAAMIKLRGRDPTWAQMSRPALKKVWRAELEELIARFNSGQRGSAAKGALKAKGSTVRRPAGQ